jgi:hypothetical protein
MEIRPWPADNHESMATPDSVVLPSISNLAYRPIDSENGEIRLVELALGQDEDPFRFTVHTQHLSQTSENDTAIEYEALSYAWGTEKCSRKVLVNGVSLPITANLDRAHRRLRYHDHARILWTDALRINQADDHERSHQVQHMA